MAAGAAEWHGHDPKGFGQRAEARAAVLIGGGGGPQDRDFHLPDAMTEKTIEWIHRVTAHNDGKPWFAYYSTGCAHAPHHVPKAWSEKYQGMFDAGWDVYPEQTFARQKKLGVVPPDAVLTPARLGLAIGEREAAVRAADGGLRRRPGERRPQRRPDSRHPVTFDGHLAGPAPSRLILSLPIMPGPCRSGPGLAVQSDGQMTVRRS